MGHEIRSQQDKVKHILSLLTSSDCEKRGNVVKPGVCEFVAFSYLKI